MSLNVFPEKKYEKLNFSQQFHYYMLYLETDSIADKIDMFTSSTNRPSFKSLASNESRNLMRKKLMNFIFDCGEYDFIKFNMRQLMMDPYSLNTILNMYCLVGLTAAVFDWSSVWMRMPNHQILSNKAQEYYRIELLNYADSLNLI